MNQSNQLDNFLTFAKSSKSKTPKVEGTNVVIYTRVSSKEQADKNLSLETQLTAIDAYAVRNNLKVQAYFGGTYESAKSDGRKEFMRMLDYIKKHKGQIKQLLVYSIDRFSRTGGGAIKLTTDLRELYGVNVLAITQPTDTSNPTGVFSQNMQLLVSQYDNDLRKLKTVEGMKTKFEKGIWVLKPPRGYDIVKINGDRKIVINAQGKYIKHIFDWKSKGVKNEEILSKLLALKYKLSKQTLCDILANPFYCGLISTTMLDGRIVEGVHPSIVSKDLFLRVNNIAKTSGQTGVPHKKENDNLPLKVFIKCDECGHPYTGYIVRAKNIYYYKCRRIGCGSNKNANQLHEMFESFLANFSIDESIIPLVQQQLLFLYHDLNKNSEQIVIDLKKSLTETNKKIDSIEEKHFVLNEMSKETFEKFYRRYQEEKSQILIQINKNANGISNHEECIKSVLDFSTKLNTTWSCSDVSTKEKIQNLIFPDGIFYNKKNNTFRTEKINSIFSCIAKLQSISAQNKNRTNQVKTDLSDLVRLEGLEPPCLAAPDPKSGMSTNFTTGAWIILLDGKSRCIFYYSQTFRSNDVNES
jgi:site-specific DNA recombinase